MKRGRSSCSALCFGPRADGVCLSCRSFASFDKSNRSCGMVFLASARELCEHAGVPERRDLIQHFLHHLSAPHLT